MKKRWTFKLLPMLALTISGCSESPSAGRVQPDPVPLSLEEAKLSLQEIDQLYGSDPVAAVAAARKLRPKLDELNRLVARVELTPEHFVDFYSSQPGDIVIAEHGPMGVERVLRDEDTAERSAVALYRQLARGATVPAALINAEARDAERQDPDAVAGDLLLPHLESSGGCQPDQGYKDGNGLSSVTQSLTSGDDAFWRDNVCYRGGDFLGCLPNRTGHGWASTNAKTSFIEVAPYRGNVSVQRSYDGSLRQTYALFAGEWWSFFQSSGTYANCCGICGCGTWEYYLRNHRWDVVDADGDGYHFAYSFRWNCNDFGCNSRP
jgi:hypothetical protein